MTFVRDEDLLVLDGAALVVLRELDEADGSSLVAQVIDLFRRDFPLRMTALRSALDESDLGAAAAAVHTLKGSCGAVGAQRMALACRQVEAFLRGGNGADARRSTDRLAAEYHLVEEAIEAMSACRSQEARP